VTKLFQGSRNFLVPTLKRRPTKSVANPVRAKKEVSVMAWIEDAYGQVLLVKQARSNKLWTFPGGKVRPRESLLAALAREVREETGMVVACAAPVDLFDRPRKSAVTILFRVLLKPAPLRVKRTAEISTGGFRKTLPAQATPSAQFFWNRAQKTFEPIAVLNEL
jgi:ADP-ribose pyrophosphatase YjhB (NUDIX family)